MSTESLSRFALAALLVGSGVAVACHPPHAYYEIPLQRMKWGARDADRDEEEPFEGERAMIEGDANRKWLYFRIHNRSEQTARIQWRRVRAVTTDGRKQGVVYKRRRLDGTTTWTKGKESKSATVIEPGKGQSCLVVPAGDLEWKYRPLKFKWRPARYLPKLYSRAMHLEGKEMHLVVPVTFGEGEEAVTVRYELRYRIDKVEEDPALVEDIAEGEPGPPAGIR